MIALGYLITTVGLGILGLCAAIGYKSDQASVRDNAEVER